VAAVASRVARRAEQLDVVDLLPAGAGDAVAVQGAAETPGKVRKALDVRQLQFLAVLGDEEEPVAAPRDIASDPAVPLYPYGDALGGAVAGHVPQGDGLAARVPKGADPDRFFQVVPAGADATGGGQRNRHANRAVAAHVKVADIVEEDDAG